MTQPLPRPARPRLAALAALALMALAPAARADVAETVKDQILPGYASFREKAAALAADPSCEAEALRPAFNAAFDAWLAVGHLRLGPAEDEGRALAIAFWPDPKGLGQKAQTRLLTGDPADLEPQRFAAQSIAARGLFALERLLYPEKPLPADGCALIRATSADLAHMAGAIEDDWTGGYADKLLAPGAAGNETFLTETEARQALFTQLATGLEFLSDQRLGRPLGTFDKPRPERAEARPSGRSQRNILLSLKALQAFAVALEPQSPQTQAAFDRAIMLAETLDDPILEGAGDPQKRLKIEILQQAVQSVRETAIAEIAPALGVDLGFNSQDGD